MRNYLILLASVILLLSGCSTFSADRSPETPSNVGPKKEALSRDLEEGAPSVVFLGKRNDDRDGLLSVADDGSVVLWNISSGEHDKIFQVNGRIDGAAFVQSRDLLAVRRGSRVAVFSVGTKTQIASLSRLKSAINSLQFDLKGETLLLGCADGNVYRWRFDTKSERLDDVERTLERYAGHPTVVSVVAMHPTGKVFFSGDWQGTIVAWRVYDADEFGGEYDNNLFDPKFFSERGLKTFREGQGHVAIEQLKISADGQYLVAGLANGTLELWQVRGFKKLSSIQAHRGVIYDLDLSPDGHRIATVGRDGYVRFWTIDQHTDASKLASPTTYTLMIAKEVLVESVRRISVAEVEAFAGSVEGDVFQLS